MRRSEETGMTPEQATVFLEQNKIRYVLAQFVDIHGSAKAKAVPVEHLGMVLTDGAGFAGFALWGFGMGPEGPDYMAVGDLATLQVIPWMPGYARLICNGVVNKKPYSFCSRVALQAQIARLTERGLTMFTGIEPEFMLLARRGDGSLGPADPTDDLDKPCYDYKGLFRTREALDEMVSGLRAAASMCIKSITRTATGNSRSTSPTPMRSSPQIISPS
jgi:glutamine synthetase